MESSETSNAQPSYVLGPGPDPHIGSAPKEVVIDMMNGALCGRSFFTTRAGYMGIGTAHAGVGDLVCIFYGGKPCYVIREQGDHQIFIGDAYVHGIMNGEFMLSDKEIVLREFVLQ
jgi:hypothetical protein